MDNCTRDLYADFMRNLQGCDTVTVSLEGVGETRYTTKEVYEAIDFHVNRRAQPENSRQHALQTGVCPMCEDCPDGCPVETPNDSRNRPENEPLTLEELRGMGGEPVYVVTLDNPLENQPYWAIAGINSNDSRYQNGVALYNRVQDDWGAFDLYGDTWLAYRHKPERSEGE